MSAGTTELTFTLLTKADQGAELLHVAYERIMRPSFVPDELPGPHSLTPGSGASVLIAKDRDTGTPLGLARLLTGNGDGVALLEYLAADPQVRGRGIGAALLSRCREIWSEAGELVVLAEVHDPRIHAESEHEHPAARLRFYERHGARLLGLPWTQPALGPETQRVEGMLLLVMYADPKRVTTELERRVVHDWARAYFEAAETGASHRSTAQVLLTLAAGGPLQIGPIADLDRLVPLPA